MRKIAFLFPGQGAQYPGMGKDVFEAHAIVRETFEEGDDLLKRHLSKIIWHGPEEELTLTYNSQPAIYLLSLAYTRLLRTLFPNLKPQFSAGLSLGEYTALATSGFLDEAKTVHIVEKRGRLMAEACQKHPGTMVAVLGLSQKQVESLVKDTKELWAANFNAPGQTVLSGTLKGIAIGTELALQNGAKKVIPLSVQGAFHSGLMQEAQERIRDTLEATPFLTSPIKVAMNASGGFPSDVNEMRSLLINQITHPVRWQETIETLQNEGVELFLEIGCGKTLSALNKRMTKVPTFSFEKLSDLESIAKECS